jgi:serine/threonine protein kinase
MLDQVVGSYKVLEKIGEGGMGEVFKGIDLMLEREVAIKSLRPELSRRQDIVERFRKEALVLARLNHPNIATLYNFFRQGNSFFMVMEFARGQPLDEFIAQQGVIPWRKALRLVCQALDGLEHAHNMGVIHRDIKPANIMLTTAGNLKLMDFGIARILHKARLTRTGHLIGTLEYMSPEPIQGRDTDARSDIYSLGIVLYEMLTGHVPFEKDSDYALIKSQVEELPQPLRNLIGQIPLELEQMVLRALAKAPEDRFESAKAFRIALENILQLSLTPDEVVQQQGGPATRFGTPPAPAVGVIPKATVFSTTESASSSFGTLAQEQPMEPLRDSKAVESAPEDHHQTPVAVSKARPLSSLWIQYPGIILLLVLVSIAAGLISIANMYSTVTSTSMSSVTQSPQPTNGISSASQSVTMPDLTAVPSTQKQPVEEDRPSQLKPPVVKNEPVETMPSGPAEEKLRTVIPTPGSAVGTGEYLAPQGTAVPGGPSEGGPPKDSNDTVEKTVPETKQTLAKPSRPSSVHRKTHRRTEEPTSDGGWKIRK